MNETTTARIAVCEHDGRWAAVYAFGDAKLSVSGVRDPAGAVLGVASKLASALEQARTRCVQIDPAYLDITYPATVGDLGVDRDDRMRKRLDRYRIRLTAGDVPAVDVADLDARDTNVFGEIMHTREEISAGRQAAHQAAAAELGAVVYWTDGSVRNHDTPGCGGVGDGGWAWVCDDGRFDSGQLRGSASELEVAAIEAAVADADRCGHVAYIVTDHSSMQELVGTCGKPVAYRGHWLRDTHRNSTPSAWRSHELARDASLACAAR